MIKKMAVTENDVFLVSFPKSGTTWLLNIVFYIMGENKEGVRVDDVVPWLDCDPYNIKPPGEQRYFKSHVPFSWIPYNKDSKYIYVARNPKDVAVSFYYFLENMQDQVIGYKKENNILMSEFIDYFAEERVLYGSWWSHVLDWYNASLKYDNILFITYEDLSSDVVSVIKKIGQFLNKGTTDLMAETIAKSCDFKIMSKDTKSSMAYCKNFWRKGVCGDHVNHFTKDQIGKFDQKSLKCLPRDLLDRLSSES